jgi:tRNA pseudouridine55 synthase
MLNGILLIDKETGITSYDVIRKIKHILWEQGRLKTEKIGHAGTLDPFASGLMILMFGSATKRFDEFQKCHKVYLAKAEFGFQTETQDVTGEKINSKFQIPNSKRTKNELQDLIDKSFVGEIMQTPPRYSAKKIDGKNAYDLAREGVEFEIKPVKVIVYKYEVLNVNWPEVDFLIECSSGTYIRTLVNDLGILTGDFATCKELRRSSIGDYKVEDAIISSDIMEGFDERVKS